MYTKNPLEDADLIKIAQGKTGTGGFQCVDLWEEFETLQVNHIKMEIVLRFDLSLLNLF